MTRPAHRRRARGVDLDIALIAALGFLCWSIILGATVRL